MPVDVQCLPGWKVVRCAYTSFVFVMRQVLVRSCWKPKSLVPRLFRIGWISLPGLVPARLGGVMRLGGSFFGVPATVMPLSVHCLAHICGVLSAFAVPSEQR